MHKNTIELKWQCLPFESLNNKALYELMRLRQQIFVAEQNCPYVDADRKDYYCLHVLGYEKSKLVAYARILPPGLAFAECSIGRVTTHFQYRGLGLGMQLMETVLAQISNTYGNVPIRIGAQSYLLSFYKYFGFEPIFAYEEDAIAHHIMLKRVVIV